MLIIVAERPNSLDLIGDDEAGDGQNGEIQDSKRFNIQEILVDSESIPEYACILNFESL